jgi:hypothetical protein
MVYLVAVIVVYSMFFMGCANRFLMKNCDHLKGDYYACEKADQ